VDYFLVKTVLKNLVPFKRYFKNSDLIFNVVIFMCYNRLCVDMFMLCVIKMTLCVMIFYPLKNVELKGEWGFVRYALAEFFEDTFFYFIHDLAFDIK
jgi:sterol desaturase/sphingolipid hydroxylase (fatty acid hydroxylase superfamily)